MKQVKLKMSCTPTEQTVRQALRENGFPVDKDYEFSIDEISDKPWGWKPDLTKLQEWNVTVTYAGIDKLEAGLSCDDSVAIKESFGKDGNKRKIQKDGDSL